MERKNKYIMQTIKSALALLSGGEETMSKDDIHVSRLLLEAYEVMRDQAPVGCDQEHKDVDVSEADEIPLHLNIGWCSDIADRMEKASRVVEMAEKIKSEHPESGIRFDINLR